MIFVTVGGQLPFDRLIEAMDGWAAKEGAHVVAQTGHGSYRATHLRVHTMLPPAEFRRRLDEAEMVVAHAGIGTILACLERKKPLLIFPRRAALGEHRNDHQLATARHFDGRSGILAAYDEAELQRQLSRLEAHSAVTAELGEPSPELVERIRRFALGGS